MKVYNPPFEFLVDSQKGTEVYKVDLLGDGGNGECSCPHYQYRLKQLIKAGQTPSSATRCKHIRRARNLAMTLIIKEVLADHAERAKLLD